MRLGTRLLWPLLTVVALVMLAYGAYAAAWRERRLLENARQESMAYATALGIALEYALADRQTANLAHILEGISREPRIYGVIVYDTSGRALQAAAPLTTADAVPAPEIRAVLRTNSPAVIERTRGEEPVYSVFRPIRDDAGLLGVLEVVQPLTPMFADVARTRLRVVVATLALGATLAIVLLFLIRRVVERPLQPLLTGARELGRGQLAHRIEETGATELAELSAEFNRMASHLQSAQQDLVRQAEQRLALERDLRNAEKLAAVGNLAAGIAHEIAAPLNVVAGRAQRLRNGERSPEVRDRDLRIIVDQIARITVIVRNLLDFARRREPRLQPVGLGSVLNGVLELLDGELERASVEVRRDWQPDLAVCGDAQLLHQVFVNLLVNSIHALEQVEGDRWIEITAREEQRSAAQKPMVTVDVSDNGVGLPADIAAQVFEPFVTTKPPGAGTGIGLAVVRSIVEEHLGTVQAFDRGQAQPGMRGALFRVILPASSSSV